MSLSNSRMSYRLGGVGEHGSTAEASNCDAAEYGASVQSHIHCTRSASPNLPWLSSRQPRAAQQDPAAAGAHPSEPPLSTEALQAALITELRSAQWQVDSEECGSAAYADTTLPRSTATYGVGDCHRSRESSRSAMRSTRMPLATPKLCRGPVDQLRAERSTAASTSRSASTVDEGRFPPPAKTGSRYDRTAARHLRHAGPGRPNHHQLDGLDGRLVQRTTSTRTLVRSGVRGSERGHPAIILDPDGPAVEVEALRIRRPARTLAQAGRVSKERDTNEESWSPSRPPTVTRRLHLRADGGEPGQALARDHTAHCPELRRWGARPQSRADAEFAGSTVS